MAAVGIWQQIRGAFGYTRNKRKNRPNYTFNEVTLNCCFGLVLWVLFFCIFITLCFEKTCHQQQCVFCLCEMHAWYLPKSSHFSRVFHEINHPFWGYHYFWKYPNLCCKPLLLEGMTRLLLRWRIGDVRKKTCNLFGPWRFFFMLCRQQYKLRFSILLNESPTNTETYESLFQYHHQQQQQKQNITCAIHYLTLFSIIWKNGTCWP